MPASKRGLCWLRRDLRTYDHAALAEATALCDQVAVAFVFDTNILEALQDKDDRRLTFIHRSLSELDAKLRDRGSQLIVLHGDPVEEIPRLAKELEAKMVVAARDYEPYARTRDERVGKALQQLDIEFGTVKDSVLMEPGEVLGREGNPIRVYTPYARAWRAAFEASQGRSERSPDLDRLWQMPPAKLGMSDWSVAKLGFIETDLWLEPGENAGRAQLQAFAEKIDDYSEDRNFPAKSGTSGLSVHFRFGTVSIREAARRAINAGSKGGDRWLSELIWRDFYQDILFHNPQVVEIPFQAQYGKLEYPGTDEHFEAWCIGQTGYPLVDAAMRCLNQTGYLHNRLRMVVASFLTKDLLIDYRKGETYFARKLLDFDLASNNGGWQWSASVGADPQPYFRIFNPTLQSKKFDPKGEFIRTYVPELKALNDEAIHFPQEAGAFELEESGVVLGEDYPLPLVDHGSRRKAAIQLLEAAKNGA